MNEYHRCLSYTPSRFFVLFQACETNDAVWRSWALEFEVRQMAIPLEPALGAMTGSLSSTPLMVCLTCIHFPIVLQ